MAAFSHVLGKQYFPPASGLGMDNGAALVLDADLQERSSMPCDTGSHPSVLDKEFLNLDLGRLHENWEAKQGPYAPDDESVRARAKRARATLEQMAKSFTGKEKKDIVVVTHGVFMKYLSGDDDINLPKAGWKPYTFKIDGEDNEQTLLLYEHPATQ